MVYVFDAVTVSYFAVGPLQGTGALAFTLPDKLGACSGTGCQAGPKSASSINSGDAYLVYAVSYDYPAFESSPPGNKDEKPVIAGAGGQADITTSAAFGSTY